MSKQKISGIYKITNIQTNKFYIGSSEDIVNRFRNHKNSLKRKCHHSVYLQHAWDKYGKDSFVFEILERQEDINKLLILEQEYIEKYDSCSPDKGYNISKYAGSPFKGRNHSEQTKQVQSEKNSGQNHWAYGKHLTTEHKELISTIKRKIPKIEEISIIAQYTSGARVIELATKYVVHVETIYRILRRNGYAQPRKK